MTAMLVLSAWSTAVHIADCTSPNTDHPAKSKSQREVRDRVRVVATIDEAYYGCGQTLVTWDELSIGEGKRSSSGDTARLTFRPSRTPFGPMRNDNAIT